MKSIKIKHILIALIFSILLALLSVISFSPLMISDGTLLTKKKVIVFDLSYTLGNAKNFEKIADIYLIDINLKKKPPIILYESLYDEATGTSLLEECDFQKIGPCIWRIPNSQNGHLVRIFSYEKGSERYYFIYKSA